MQDNLIGLAVPGFFLLMALEGVAARWRRRSVYRFSDSITDLGCGVLQQVVAVFAAATLLGVYSALYEHRLTDTLQEGWLAWALCFVGVDLGYYWFHRFSHECALAWVTHVVHHQSEDYNLAVALRQDAFQPFLSFTFYLPLALLGLPPAMYVACASLNTLYQFWIHTRLVGKLGPLEWIMNTPSHHRVHHGADPKYLDRNYAGVFIIWDRLFGTFKAEEEEPTYGVTEPVESWNPIFVHMHYIRALANKVRALPGLSNKLQGLLRGPGWMPSGMELQPKDVRGRPLYDVQTPPRARIYVLVQFVVVLVAAVLLMFTRGQMAGWQQAVLGLFVAVSLGTLGGVQEQRSWAVLAERARTLAMVGLPFLLLPMGALLWGLVAAGVISHAWAHVAVTRPVASVEPLPVAAALVSEERRAS